MKKIISTLILFVLGSIAFANGTTDIADIQAQPRLYVGETLKIAGDVTQVRSIPLSDYELQSVYDGTGMLSLLTNIPRSVGDSLEPVVEIIGLNTEGAEEASDGLANSLARSLEEQGWLTPQEARNMAEKLDRGLKVILRAMDISLLGLEIPQEPDSPGVDV